MFQKSLSFLLALLLLTSPAYASSGDTLFVRPGKSERIPFTAPAAGQAAVELLGADGAPVAQLESALQVVAGENYFVWDGRLPGGAMAQQGDYTLRFTQNGAGEDRSLSVGSASPVIESFAVSGTQVRPRGDWQVTAVVNQPGTLSVSMNFNGIMQPVASMQAQAGSNTLVWDGTYNGRLLMGGTHMLLLSLTDANGFSGNPHYINIQLLDAAASAQSAGAETAEPAQEAAPSPTAEPAPTPAPTQRPAQYKAPTNELVPEGQAGGSYWTLPVGKIDEQAVWNVMMQPITVVKGLSKAAQKEMYRLRAAPDDSMKNDNILGEITCESQGVHILETLDSGWTLVEVFNSSYGPDCNARPGWGNSDELIKGYVETERLKTITPAADYGLLVDKLEQKLHVFKEGRLFSSLEISTGLPTKKQPWNETPSGEYLMVSKVGGFYAGNLYCGMGMRINGGCLLHEVPYIENAATGYKDYSAQEAQLGEKASHGCIRIQRKANDEGLNMTWLWNNLKVNTKVLVWDDNPGRFTEYPSDDLVLYYNPNAGKYYHLDQNCRSIKKMHLPLKGSFAYGHLDEEAYAKLTPCKTCQPPQRKVDIDAQNLAQGFQP